MQGLRVSRTNAGAARVPHKCSQPQQAKQTAVAVQQRETRLMLTGRSRSARHHWWCQMPPPRRLQ